MSIVPLNVEEFSKWYVNFHNILFPNDKLNDSTLRDLIEEFRLVSSMYGVEFFGIYFENRIVGLFSMLKRSSNIVDCKVDVAGEPPGEVLGDSIVNYLEQNCSSPQVIIPSNLTAVISKLEALGYRLYNRFARLTLNLEEFNFNNFREYVKKFSIEGLTFKSLFNVLDRISDIVKLVNETSKDEPTTGGMDYMMSVEELKYLIDQGRLVEEACYVAFKDEKVIAVTLVARASIKEAYFIYTGVLRPYRGLDLAKAVKALALTKLKELGYVKASANNNLENKPILAINRRLGFKIVREYLDYRRAQGLS
jgi:GNAT superfamily N-acetyltransferase